MKLSKQLVGYALLTLLFVPAVLFAQEQTTKPVSGEIEFGFRGVTGGTDTSRSDVFHVNSSNAFANGFQPNVLNSTLNEYNDYRSGFYIGHANVRMDNALGQNTYFNVQSSGNGIAFDPLDRGNLLRNQSLLATAGQYGVYKLQLKFDETPHIFSGTTQTIFSSGGNVGGNAMWNVPANLQSTVYTCLSGANAATACPMISNSMFPGFTSSAANSVTRINGVMSSLAAGQLGFAGTQPFTQQEIRRMGSGSGSWNINPDWNVNFLVSREHQLGTRPIGVVMGNSSGGYEAEVPETIDYYTNNVKFGTEYGKQDWSVMGAYQGSFFEDNAKSMLVMNPFSNTFTTNVTTYGPQTVQMETYPDNRYQQFVGQGATNITKYVRFMANVTPGVMNQNEQFQSLTSNPSISQTPQGGYPALLPANSLNGSVYTLAMNYTAVAKPMKNLEVVAKFLYYTYDNHTPELLIQPAIGDTALISSGTFHGSTAGCYDPVRGTSTLNVINATYNYYCPTEQSSFTRRTFDIGGTYFFTKKSSAKFGFNRETMDRTNRSVDQTIENSLYGAVDVNLRKDVFLRVSARHQNRMPQGTYDPIDSYDYNRNLDESTRIRNRGDVSLQWDATQKLSLTAFWGTLQDNFNLKSSFNSPNPLTVLNSPLCTGAGGSCIPLTAAGVTAGAVPTPIYGNFYALGLLNNIGQNFGFDASYVFTKKVVFFAEYVREKNTGLMIQGPGNDTSGCVPGGPGWTGTYSSSCNPINDLLSRMKDMVNTYYGGMDVAVSKKLDVSLYYSLSAAQSFVNTDGVYCQIGNTGNPNCLKNFTGWSLDTATNPAVTWSYPQVVDRTHEVGVVAKFKLTKNMTPKFQYMYRQNDTKDWQTGVINPYSFVGATIDPNGASALQKFLLLGSDNPSYHAHVFTGTLEYRF